MVPMGVAQQIHWGTRSISFHLSLGQVFVSCLTKMTVTEQSKVETQQAADHRAGSCAGGSLSSLSPQSRK